MKNGDTDMDLIKAIKAAKEVFIDVPLNTRSIWVKANKTDLLERFAIEDCSIEDELEIVTQYGKSALYLGRKDRYR